MAKQRQHRSKRQFIQLWTNLKRSDAYYGLSCGARALLIELIDRYNGRNNGRIVLGIRDAAYELRCSKSGAGKFFRELDDAGLVRPEKVGVWQGKQASEYRLTFHVSNVTGELPVKNWNARPDRAHSPPTGTVEAQSQSTHEDTKVHPRGQLPIHSPPTKTVEGKNPMKRPNHSPPTGTHIDIYQVGTTNGARDDAHKDASAPTDGPLPASEWPDLPPELDRRPKANGNGAVSEQPKEQTT